MRQIAALTLSWTQKFQTIVKLIDLVGAFNHKLKLLGKLVVQYGIKVGGPEGYYFKPCIVVSSPIKIDFHLLGLSNISSPQVRGSVGDISLNLPSTTSLSFLDELVVQ